MVAEKFGGIGKMEIFEKIPKGPLDAFQHFAKKSKNQQNPLWIFNSVILRVDRSPNFSSTRLIRLTVEVGFSHTQKIARNNILSMCAEIQKDRCSFFRLDTRDFCILIYNIIERNVFSLPKVPHFFMLHIFLVP